MGDLAKRIIASAEKRVRPGRITVGGEVFAVDFRVYPAADLTALTDKIRNGDNAAGAAILAEQVLDPADKRPVFTAAQLEALPNCDMVAVLNAFLRINLGETEKN